jgi:hypothetical protein
MPDVSTLTLNNGVELPALGLGVFQTPAEETRAAVEAALSAGCSVRPPGGARRRQGRQQPAPGGEYQKRYLVWPWGAPNTMTFAGFTR